jgi:hypothetical protein
VSAVETPDMDITTSVDSVAQILCGQTTSFSPFAIFKSEAPFLSATGFYPPVSRVAGFVNTVKGGSTVPLKFEVFIDGVEKTTTDQLQFTVTPFACSPGVEDPVDYVTNEAPLLRYDNAAGHFTQNWRVPKTPGASYVVQVTTGQNGPVLAARFKVK